MGFDIPYMMDRAGEHMHAYLITINKVMKDQHAIEGHISLSSSAYRNQEFRFLDAEGRLFVDLLPLIKRDKFSNYKLKTVSEFFLGESKIL